METTNTTPAEQDAAESALWKRLTDEAHLENVERAIEAMRFNGNGPECLPHLACGGTGCTDCIGGALACNVCLHRVAVTVVPDGGEGMVCCGWCESDLKAAGLAELERLANEAGEVARAEREQKGAA